MHEINFHMWNISNYEDRKLILNDGQKVIYKLDGRWQIRTWDEQGFYFGTLLKEFYDILDIARYLNSKRASLQ